jgi:hypothetical protein
LTTFATDDFGGLRNILAGRDVPVGAPRFHAEIAHASIGVCTMNIFYIIGVIVVVLFVAGFFGLHA